MSTSPSPDAPTSSSLTIVAAIMSGPLVTVTPQATLWEARSAMTSAEVHHLLVIDRGKIVGIISDRDIAHRLSPAAARGLASRHDEEAVQRRVLQIATFDMVTIAANAPIEEAAALIIEHGVSALPVLDEAHQFVGIVTTRDLLRGMLACALPNRHTSAA